MRETMRCCSEEAETEQAFSEVFYCSLEQTSFLLHFHRDIAEKSKRNIYRTLFFRYKDELRILLVPSNIISIKKLACLIML